VVLAAGLALVGGGCTDDRGDRWAPLPTALPPSVERIDAGGGAGDGSGGGAGADVRDALPVPATDAPAPGPSVDGAGAGAPAGTGAGPACDSCESTGCGAAAGDYVTRCLLAPGRSGSGPRAGAARATLCAELVACMRRTACGASAGLDCYCGGGVSLTSCQAGMGTGACKGAVESGAESTDPAVVMARLHDRTFATGNAFNLLERCDRPVCAAACGLRAGAPACPGPDLDGNGMLDCRETMTANADFARDGAGWDAEVGATLAWDARDAEAHAGSGSLAVTNTASSNVASSSMAGGRRCLPVAGGTVYRLLAQVMMPAGQPSATAGLAAAFHASADCSGPLLAAVPLPLASKLDVWSLLTADAQAPAVARSLQVRLVVVKPFTQPAVRALFDNVLVRPR
jgi:hypothetical protein